MLHESLMDSNKVTAPLSFSPEGYSAGLQSPAYVPVSPMWAGPPDGPSEASVVFGPGVQLPLSAAQERAAVDSIASQVHRMEIDGEAAVDSHAGPDHFTSKVFADLPVPPALATSPARSPSPSPRAKTTLRGKQLKVQRVSSRLAANCSAIPVAKRAQHRMIRELSFVAPEEDISEQVAEAYLKTYKKPLPVKTVEVIRSATRLSNNKISKALAAMVASGGAGADVE